MPGRRNSLKAFFLSGTGWLPWVVSEGWAVGKHSRGTVLQYRSEPGGERWRERPERKVHCSAPPTPIFFVLRRHCMHIVRERLRFISRALPVA